MIPGLSLDETVRRIANETPGWSPPEQLLVLATLSAATDRLGGDVIEVGSWCGRSAAALALGLRPGRGAVHAIDIFPTRSEWRENEDGTWSCFSVRNGRTIASCVDVTVWKQPFEEHIAPLYARAGEDGVRAAFDRTLEAFGVADRVIAHAGESRDFVERASPDLRCRLAFLDGDHGYDSVCRDLDMVERFLAPGGWLCLDDAFTVYDGIDRAIRERVIDGPYENGRQATRKMFIAQRRG
ncbi:MAG: class I SAM-dependent methyltransferase [Caulobacteraceae bacterium]